MFCLIHGVLQDRAYTSVKGTGRKPSWQDIFERLWELETLWTSKTLCGTRTKAYLRVRK